MWLDAGILRGALRAAAVVARGGHHDNPCRHQTLRRQRERVGVIRLVHTRRNRQIHDPDVQRRFVRQNVVERRDDVADASPSRIVEDFENDEVCAGRDAGSGAAGIEPVARNDSRDVRAVAVIIVRGLTPVDEIDESIHA